jgi:hypothetical protein
MFRFTQESSSGRSPVLKLQNGFSLLVGIDTVNIMAAYQPVVQACVSQCEGILEVESTGRNFFKPLSKVCCFSLYRFSQTSHSFGTCLWLFYLRNIYQVRRKTWEEGQNDKPLSNVCVPFVSITRRCNYSSR